VPIERRPHKLLVELSREIGTADVLGHAARIMDSKVNCHKRVQFGHSIGA
jgi:hypothetical protein